MHLIHPWAAKIKIVSDKIIKLTRTTYHVLAKVGSGEGRVYAAAPLPHGGKEAFFENPPAKITHIKAVWKGINWSKKHGK